MGGKLLATIAAEWQLDLMQTARRLMPAGAVYHCMEDADVEPHLAASVDRDRFGWFAQ